MKNYVFWIFGILQSVSLGLIIFLLFHVLRNTSSAAGIGLDTQILLSISFPLFLLICEYIIYAKLPDRESKA
jgi:ABC-type transport system involved in multi-copper enzyme maturation permease subunit